MLQYSLRAIVHIFYPKFMSYCSPDGNTRSRIVKKVKDPQSYFNKIEMSLRESK